jgi:hypothetical protein
MLHKPGLHFSDAASWVMLALLGLGCVWATDGLNFVVDVPRAVLPGLGLLILVGAVVFAKVRRREKLLAGATAFLQMTLFTVLAVTLAYALAARSGPLQDVELAAADAWLGLQWPAILRVADMMPGALWLGGIAYESLTTQMIVCIVVLSATGRTDALRTAVAAAILSGAVTIAISGVVPAMGNLFDPAAYRHLPASIAWQERGLIAGLRDGSERVFDFSRLMGIVSFPSYHSTLPVILAWALRDVRFLRVAAPVSAAVTILATPIFGGHYGVDVLGGLSLAVLAIAIAPRVAAGRLSLNSNKEGRYALQYVLRQIDMEPVRTVQARRLVNKELG